MELNVICSQLYQLLSVIQGVVLHHTASKAYLGRQYPLEVRSANRICDMLSRVPDLSGVINNVTTHIDDYASIHWQFH